MQHYAMVLYLAVLLGGCGGGGGGGSSGIDPRLARLDIYEAQKQRVLGDPGAGVMAMTETAPENVPSGGDFVFQGSATVRVEDSVQPLVLIGDAVITLSFGAGSGIGQVTNVFGNNSAGTIVDYSGAINLETMAAGAVMDFAYAGALTAIGETLLFDGVMQGTLLGNPVGAIAAADLEAVVDYNGRAADATFVLIGETPVTP